MKRRDASLVRTGEAVWDELERCTTASFDVPNQTAANTLTAIDGDGQPLTPTEIGDRIYKSSATITTTIDALERRGWVRRTTNPGDRRSVLVEITETGQAVGDQITARHPQARAARARRRHRGRTHETARTARQGAGRDRLHGGPPTHTARRTPQPPGSSTSPQTGN
jgi:DNA-binding MarR family transcriptional regulator